MADEAPKIFTLEEANALLPALELEFGRLARLRSELGPLIEALGGPETAVEILQEGRAPAAGRERVADRLRSVAGEIRAGVERVNALGCVVKDIEAGLVDFFAMRDEEPVFLCWQFGEPAVAHWHTVEEGFAGRRPIEGIEIEPPDFPN